MPDIVADKLGQVQRSRRRFALLMGLAAAALVLAGLAFTFSLSRNWQNTADATRRANVAIVKANAAARHANLAAMHAESAHKTADRARADLCAFLATVRSDRALDERHTASALFVEFGCRPR